MTAEDKQKQFKQILEELCKELLHVKAVALADLENCCLLAGILPPECDEEMVCAVLDPAVNLVEHSLKEYGHKHVKHMCIKGKRGFIILHVVTGKIILFIQTSYKIQLDSLPEKVQKAARKIARLLGTIPVTFR